MSTQQRYQIPDRIQLAQGMYFHGRCRFLEGTFLLHAFVLLLLLISTHHTIVLADSPIDNDDESHATVIKAQLQEGVVQGIRSNGMDFYGGIPYAAPPVGNLRWAPPQEPPSWKPHALDATQFGPDCYQIADRVSNPLADPQGMSEDCLYLNIYTPAGASSNHKHHRLPVMVWFHGGAFQQGAAKRPEYDARKIASEEQVVVVTVNYRLGALGFLVSSELGLLGNYGLMDQRAALYFIQRQVATFGGDNQSITLFGESAGAVMIGLHLQMENSAPQLFHRAILQSNPMGYQFRSVVVADFLGAALQRSVDCKDLACLRSEPVEEIMRAQSSLMGLPRSVGDFFTWGPTLTHQRQISMHGGRRRSPTSSSYLNSSPLKNDRNSQYRSLFSVETYAKQRESTKFNVNVTQPLLNFHLVPDEIPIVIGTNKHEGEMFVHSAFPITMSKAVYWMFVGALFKDSASRVLKHYRPYVALLEEEAKEIAETQVLEEKHRQYYLEHREELEQEYAELLAHNSSVVSPETIDRLVETLSAGGGDSDEEVTVAGMLEYGEKNDDDNQTMTVPRKLTWKHRLGLETPDEELLLERRRLREERIKQKKRDKALKEAAKVGVDYRPVMSHIINDYLFRCPSWHYAHMLSRNRKEKQKTNNVYVFRFSQPTHIPGYPECWGKSCHASELPYPFQAMSVIRSNYSTLSSYARAEAPSAPVYPFTSMMNAYHGATTPQGIEDLNMTDQEFRPFGEAFRVQPPNETRSFQRILKHFFDDYFGVDVDEEMASDMSQRWIAFARSGDPNYSGSKTEWMPWRFIPKEVRNFVGMDDRIFERQEYDDIWSGLEQEADSDQNVSDSYLVEDTIGQAYRRRALQALGMAVVEENALRTELKSTKNENRDPDNPFFNFLSRLGVSWKAETEGDPLPIETIRHVQRIAQDMGVLGTGLRTEEKKMESSTYWDDDFFPQLLELKWPPESRFVERDCSCDFWEKVRYRY